jgi:hypothetical protein
MGPIALTTSSFLPGKTRHVCSLCLFCWSSDPDQSLCFASSAHRAGLGFT